MEEKRPTLNDALAGCGCSLLLWAVIIGCCLGIFSCDNHQRNERVQREIDKRMRVVDENGGHFKVLYTYPVYNNKGHFRGHSVVAEGVTSKQRIEASPHPLLPVPGEIWEVTVVGEYDTARYKFVRKIDGR